MIARLFACCCLFFTVAVGLADDRPKADIVIHNANVWTGNPDQPTAQAVIIVNGRIAAVGSNALIDSYRGGARIDVGRSRVIPGLIDCHTHLISGGLTLSQLQLREAKDKRAFIDAVKQHSETLKPTQWVLGRGWTTESWAVPQTPTREWIDGVTGQRPALLSRMDGHQALANSKALALAGIDKNTPDPPGGTIDRDSVTGEPTGILRDEAMGLVQTHIPPPNPVQLKAAMRKAMETFNQHGITTIHDMSNVTDARVFKAVSNNPADRRLRIHSYCQTSEWSDKPCFSPVPELRDWLVPAGFKAYMDGSLGSRTAYMRLPYSDNPPHQADNCGLQMPFATNKSPSDLVSQCRRAADGQLQPAVHAIGDQANHLLLNAYELSGRGVSEWRPRIEHAQHLLPADIPRFASIGAIASMQPFHKADDGRYAQERIGSVRCQTSYAFKSLIEHDTVLCFGSDWPVVSNNPFLGMASAVSGLTVEGKPFVTEQSIDIEQALTCYTKHAAYACYREDQLGTLKPGYLADLVVLKQDILSVPVDRIANTEVLMTIVDGRGGLARDRSAMAVTDDQQYCTTITFVPCRHCGYDLRGRPQEGHCPECGASYRIAALYKGRFESAVS